MLILLRQDITPVGILDAAGFALVFRLIFGACGEAAGRVGQRQMPVAQYFGFKLVANTQFVTLVKQVHQPIT
ncbi:hypothetical protein D3C81_1924630 [compost metagenome]